MLAFSDAFPCVKRLEKGIKLTMVGYFAPRNKMKSHIAIWLKLKAVFVILLHISALLIHPVCLCQDLRYVICMNTFIRQFSLSQ